MPRSAYILVVILGAIILATVSCSGDDRTECGNSSAERSAQTPATDSVQPQQTPLPEPGPPSQGLRLRLTITNLDTDKHLFRLDIINVCDKTLMLRTFKEGRTFADSLQCSTTFTATPEVYVRRFHYMCRLMTSIAPSHVLAPGELVTGTWIVHGRSIQDSESPLWSMRLRADGQYYLRAHLGVSIVNHGGVKLWSNEAPIIVGGSTEAPRLGIADVITVIPDDDRVRINLGRVHGVTIGEKFNVYYDHRRAFTLTIQSVGLAEAEASIARHTPDNVTVPPVPKVGDRAILLRKGEWW